MSHLPGGFVCVVICPKCRNNCLAQSKKFCSSDFERSHKCCVCGKFSISHLWHCSCDVRWHLCGKHVPITQHRSRVKATPKGRSGLKRKFQPSLQDLLDKELDCEARRARREDESQRGSVCLEVPSSSSSGQRLRATMLPPSLRERFSHVLA